MKVGLFGRRLGFALVALPVLFCSCAIVLTAAAFDLLVTGLLWLVGVEVGLGRWAVPVIDQVERMWRKLYALTQE